MRIAHTEQFKVNKFHKAIQVTFGLLDLYDFNFMKNKIFSNIVLNARYTVSCKRRYSEDSYIMAGKQFGFIFQGEDEIKDLISIVSDKINLSLEN